MLWKMWVKHGDEPLIVEAENLDEAFMLARRSNPDYSSAQPMDEAEEEAFRAKQVQ